MLLTLILLRTLPIFIAYATHISFATLIYCLCYSHLFRYSHLLSMLLTLTVMPVTLKGSFGGTLRGMYW